MASNYNVDLAMFHRIAEAEFPNCLGVGGDTFVYGAAYGGILERGDEIQGSWGNPTPRKYPFICMSFAASLKCERGVDSGLIDGMLQNAELGGGGSS